MSTTNPVKKRITALKETYDRLRAGKESILRIIDEVELSESVYNSNAIENSALTLKETEKILMEMEVSRDVSLREVFEAKNLARVIEYLRAKKEEISEEKILLWHKMLLASINDDIAGRFRGPNEFVRVGAHVAPNPEHVERLMGQTIIEYTSDHESYFADRVAKFHLDFETIHPFNDGNGRIGRVIINYQLAQLHFPNIIIRDKEKQFYYQSFIEYRDAKKTKKMESVLTLALTESLHKRIAYLKGNTIVPLAEFAKDAEKSLRTLLNAARRQTIPAFREKGVWKIGKDAIGV